MNTLITLRNKFNKWLWQRGLVRRHAIKMIDYEAFLAPRAKYLKVAFWFFLGFGLGVIV